jgi:hypothetical protein
MVGAHDAFLAAWDQQHTVPSKATLSEAATAESDAGIAAWVAGRLADDPDSRPVPDFRPEYRAEVAADRERLLQISRRLSQLSPDADPKLALLLASPPVHRTLGW